MKLLKAQDFLAQRQWSDAEPILTAIQAEIRDEKTGFEGLSQRVDEMLAQAKELRAVEEARNQDQQRLQTFRLHRKEALVNETHFTTWP